MRPPDVDVSRMYGGQGEKGENVGDGDGDGDEEDEICGEELSTPGCRGGDNNNYTSVLRSRTNTTTADAAAAAAAAANNVPATPVSVMSRKLGDLQQKTQSASPFTRPFGFASSASGRGSSVRLFPSSVPPSARGKAPLTAGMSVSPLNTPTRIPGERQGQQSAHLLQTPGTSKHTADSSSARHHHQMLTVTPVSSRLNQLRENAVAAAASTPVTPVPPPKTHAAAMTVGSVLRPHVFATPRTPTRRKTTATTVPPQQATLTAAAGNASAAQSARQLAAAKENKAAVIAQTKERIKSFRFFFDCGDQKLMAQEIQQVKELGAKVELFMSNKVTHLVTNKPIPPEPIAASIKSKTPSRSPVVKRPLDVSNSKASPVSAKRGLFATAGRSRGIEDNITTARNFGAHIWTLERLQLILKAVNGVAAPRKLQDHLRDEKLYGISTTRDAEHQKLKYRVFKERYLLVEDATDMYRPIMVKEYHEAEDPADPPWPVMALKDRPGGCPFLRDYHAMEPHNAPSDAGAANADDRDMPPTIRLEDTVTGDHASESDAAKDASMEPPSNPQHRVSAASGLVSMSAAVPQRLAANKTAAIKQLDKRELAVKAGRKSRAGSGPAKHDGRKPDIPLREHRVVGTAFYTRPGYCENCNLKYEIFVDHVRSNAHKAWLAQANFQDLDFLLAKIARKPKVPVTTTNDASTVKRVRADSLSKTLPHPDRSSCTQHDCASVPLHPAAKRPRLDSPTCDIESASQNTPTIELSAPASRSAQKETPSATHPVTPAVSSVNPDTLPLFENAAPAAEPPPPREPADEANVRPRVTKAHIPVRLPPFAPPTSESAPLATALGEPSPSLQAGEQPSSADQTITERKRSATVDHTRPAKDPAPVAKPVALPLHFPRNATADAKLRVSKPSALPPFAPVAWAQAAQTIPARPAPSPPQGTQSPSSRGGRARSVGSPLHSDTSTPPSSPAVAPGHGVLGRTIIAVPTNSPRGSKYRSPHRRRPHPPPPPPPKRFGMRNDPHNPFVDPQSRSGGRRGRDGVNKSGPPQRSAAPVVGGGAPVMAEPLPAWPRKNATSVPPAMPLTLRNKTSSPVSVGQQDVSLPCTPCRPSPSLETDPPDTPFGGGGNGARDQDANGARAKGTAATFQNPRLNLVYDMSATSPSTVLGNSDADAALSSSQALPSSLSMSTRRPPQVPPLLALKREAIVGPDRRQPVKRLRLILGPRPAQDTSPARLRTDADDDEANDDEDSVIVPASPTTTDVVERDDGEVFGMPVLSQETATPKATPRHARERRGSCQQPLLKLKLKLRPRSMSAAAAEYVCLNAGLNANDQKFARESSERGESKGASLKKDQPDCVADAVRPLEVVEGSTIDPPAANSGEVAADAPTATAYDQLVAGPTPLHEINDATGADERTIDVAASDASAGGSAADAPTATGDDHSLADATPLHKDDNASAAHEPTVDVAASSASDEKAAKAPISVAEGDEPHDDASIMNTGKDLVVDLSTPSLASSGLTIIAEDNASDADTATPRTDNQSAPEPVVPLADNDESVNDALIPRAAPLKGETLREPSSPCQELAADPLRDQADADEKPGDNPARAELEDVKETSPETRTIEEANCSSPPLEAQDSDCADVTNIAEAATPQQTPRRRPAAEANLVCDANSTPRARFWRTTSDFMRIVLNSDDDEDGNGNDSRYGSDRAAGSSPASSAISINSSTTATTMGTPRAQRASWAAALAAERQKRADAWRRSRQRVLPLDGSEARPDWDGSKQEEEQDEFDVMMMTSSTSMPDRGFQGNGAEAYTGCATAPPPANKHATKLSRDPAWYHDLCLAVASEPISSEGDH
ncbi:hypothetical protein HDU86_002811 [Geranomyces michiganensis]|nr:hypothetical protein HDU86_002811 [Geranomyces michiganensis]